MTKKIHRKFSILFLCLLIPALIACSKKVEEKPVVLGSEVNTAPDVKLINGKIETAVTANITLSKAEILNREFLYGLSLQSSSLIEDKIATALLAIAIGQAPAKFKIVGNTLQLVADQSINFESDVNRPERLVHEFPILSQNEHSITILASKGSAMLASILFGAQAPATQQLWMRSWEVITSSNLMMMETSIEMKDGSLAELMETIMPRTNLVPENYKTLYNDASLEPLAERFRFLDADKVFINAPGKKNMRIQTAIANRFHLKSENDQIKWHVTANVPDEYLNDIRSGIEGWNRYSQAMWGRDFIKFEGKLPAGVKIGDPRYNIVVWDTVQDAGSAYESQAADPLTGIQSHSLIYLPLAWINIGKAYWENGKYSQNEQNKTEQKIEKLSNFLKKRNFLGRALPVHCLEDATKQVSMKARVDGETFARELLKGVLLHEVGHALGLAHNFKGSLSFDPEDEKSIFTTSVMDYNHYNEESAVFDHVDAATGPLFEYDRQIISALYNDAKDIKDTDPIVPACNDEEADSRLGGVDPLCVRYDIGKDPTEQVLRTLKLLQEENLTNGSMQSLPKALRSLTAELGNPLDIESIAQAKSILAKLTAHTKGIMTMYIASTANSLGYKASQAVKSLYVFTPGVLPETYNEAKLRANTLEALKAISTMETLPATTTAALNSLSGSVAEWLKSTKAIQGIPAGKERDEALEAALAPLKTVDAYAAKTLFPSMRRRTLSQLSYSPTAPLFLGNASDGSALDLEAFAIELLEKSLTTKASGENRPASERAAYATSLVSFAPTELGAAAIARAKAALTLEINSTKDDALTRESLRSLLKILK